MSGYLVLSRRVNEAVVMRMTQEAMRKWMADNPGDPLIVEVRLARVKSNESAQLAFGAPMAVEIHREEVLRRIEAE